MEEREAPLRPKARIRRFDVFAEYTKKDWLPE